ncbi:hypothetical protein K8R43_02175, partial [archaeon]|nr:hypothetical protein [archaeon]
CRDCQFSVIVFPNEFAPAFLWVRASAGSILLLAALIMLGALVHLWMKRKKPKKTKPKLSPVNLKGSGRKA